MAYEFKRGDKVRIKNDAPYYATLNRGETYYVVDFQGYNIGVARDRNFPAINYYKPSSFYLVEAANAACSKSDVPKFDKTQVVIVHGVTGSIVRRCNIADIEYNLRELLKDNFKGSYVVYAPQYEARFPELPISVTPITVDIPTESGPIAEENPLPLDAGENEDDKQAVS